MLLSNLPMETISIIGSHSRNQICKINIKKTSLLPALQPGILILFQLASSLVSFDFVVSFDSNVTRLTTFSQCWLLLLYIESFFLHFHFPVVTGELAVHQLITCLGNMTKPVLTDVGVRCYSGTHTHGGFGKQKDDTAFTHALEQCP